MKQASKPKRIGTELTRIVSILLNDFYNGMTRLTKADICRRFYVDSDTASRILDILPTITTTNDTHYLPLSKEGPLVRVQGNLDNPHSYKRIRLNSAETRALWCALDQAGIINQTELTHTLRCFIDPQTSSDDLIKILNNTQLERSASILQQCACACLAEMSLMFSYQTNTHETKNYEVDPLFVTFSQDHWYLIAWDLKEDKQKTFNQLKMSHVKLCGKKCCSHETDWSQVFSFNEAKQEILYFKDKTLLDSETWKNFTILEETENTCTISIANAGSLWLPKQIASSGGLIVAENDKLNQQACDWALRLLKQLNKLSHE